LAIVVSSTSIKVATDTIIAISQGFVPMTEAPADRDADIAFVSMLIIEALEIYGPMHRNRSATFQFRKKARPGSFARRQSWHHISLSRVIGNSRMRLPVAL
jgi:hypothetical protein